MLNENVKFNCKILKLKINYKILKLKINYKLLMLDNILISDSWSPRAYFSILFFR